MSHRNKKSCLRNFKPGTPEYIVGHACWQTGRGRQPSLSYGDIKNPKEAYRAAYGEICTSLNDFLQQVGVLADLILDSDGADCGRELFEAGKYAEAIPHLERAAGQWSDVEYPYMLAKAYFQKEEPDFDASIEAFLQALQRSDAVIYGDTAKWVYEGLGDVLKAAGRSDAAALCQQIVGVLAQNPEAQIKSSDLMLLQGQLNTIARLRNTAADADTRSSSNLGLGLGSEG